MSLLTTTAISLACIGILRLTNAEIYKSVSTRSNEGNEVEKEDKTVINEEVTGDGELLSKRNSELALNDTSNWTRNSKTGPGTKKIYSIAEKVIADRSSDVMSTNLLHKIIKLAGNTQKQAHKRRIMTRSTMEQELENTMDQSRRPSDCQLYVSPTSVQMFNKRVLYQHANFLTLKIKFSNGLNVTWLAGVILPMTWIWVYEDTKTILNMPHEAGVWSLGLLDLYHKGPVDVVITNGSEACKYYLFSIGKNTTDAMIGDALANMTNDIALRELRYNTSSWCYMKRAKRSGSRIFKSFDHNLFSVSPSLQYVCCAYTLEIHPKRRVKCSHVHNYDSVWWDVPLVVGILMLLFFPLQFLKLTGKLHEAIKKSSVKDTTENERADAPEQCGGESIRPANEPGRQNHKFIYYNGKSPITAASVVYSSVSNLMPAKQSTKSRVAIFVWPLMTLIIPGIEVLTYYFFLYEYAKELAYNNMSFGFSSVLIGWKAKDSKFSIFGGPFIALGLYVIIGWILMLTPKVMANQIYRGICERDSSIKSILCIGLTKKESLGSVQIRKSQNGYLRLRKLQICHLYMLLNPDYWRLTGIVVRTRFCKFMTLLKARIPVKIFRGIILLLCVPFYAAISFIEILFAVIYYACPMLSFLISIIKGFQFGLNKYISEKVSVRSSVLGNALRVPLCAIVILFTIYYLYIFTVLFLDGFFFVSRILLFTYTAVVAYPRESYGYFMLILLSAYFGLRGFVKFGDIYKLILKLAIKICRQDESLREYLICNQDIDNNQIYGISRVIFEYLVENIRPRRVQVFSTIIQLASMIFVLTVSIVLIEHFDRFSDISVLIHVFMTMFICAVPTIYKFMVSQDYIKVKMTRKIKRCLRIWMSTHLQDD